MSASGREETELICLLFFGVLSLGVSIVGICYAGYKICTSVDTWVKDGAHIPVSIELKIERDKD